MTLSSINNPQSHFYSHILRLQCLCLSKVVPHCCFSSDLDFPAHAFVSATTFFQPTLSFPCVFYEPVL